MKDQWWDRLRRRMEDHEEVPPEGLWDDIRRALDREAADGSISDQQVLDRRAGKPARKRSPLLWRIGAGAAASIAAILMLLVYEGPVNNLSNDPDESLLTNTPTVPTVANENRDSDTKLAAGERTGEANVRPEPVASVGSDSEAASFERASIVREAIPAWAVKGEREGKYGERKGEIRMSDVYVNEPRETALAHVAEIPVSETRVAGTSVAETSESEIQEVSTAGKPTSETPSSEVSTPQNLISEASAAKSNGQLDGTTGKRQTAVDGGAFDFGRNHYVRVSRSKRNRWQAGLYASNISSNGSSNSSSGRLMDTFLETGSAYAPVNHNHDGIIYIGSSSDQSSSVGRARFPVSTDIIHRLPVTVGASVSYGLGERWSLVSGLTYTMLSSRSRTTSESNYHSTEQTLHYLGIPLNINYDIWSIGGLSIYLSGGGHVEKSVSGSTRYRRIVNNAVISEQKTSVSDRVQWSINGSVGVQYDFVRKVGLYAEPGVNYFFDNGSRIETIYKAKPLNFGLRAGLRISL